jgi:hypothetical protein
MGTGPLFKCRRDVFNKEFNTFIEILKSKGYRLTNSDGNEYFYKDVFPEDGSVCIQSMKKRVEVGWWIEKSTDEIVYIGFQYSAPLMSLSPNYKLAKEIEKYLKDCILSIQEYKSKAPV